MFKYQTSNTEHQNAKQLFDSIKNKITVYQPQEATEITFWLLEHYLKLTKTDILLGKNIKNNETDWKNVISRINNNEPIQYILGETNFCGSRFLVNPAVLIPRPETEELVNMIVGNYSLIHSFPHSIIDIGTGSGCIAISLAKAFPESTVFTWDISASALETATQNAKINDVENVIFEQKDILNCELRITNYEQFGMELENKKYISHQTGRHSASNISFIVSNPPYIRPTESVEMRENVMSHEPHLALFVPENDPLLFYRAIAQFAQNNLAPNGQIWLEINELFGIETATLFEEHGFLNTQIVKDFQGKDRFIRSSR